MVTVDQGKIRKAKELFRTGHEVPEGMIRPIILESWKRSRAFGVQMDCADKSVIPRSALERRIYARRDFYNIAVPFMERLAAFTTGSGYLTVIADEEGYILRAFGEAEITRLAEENGLVEGGNRSERRLGTNGIGTALELGEPIQVLGEEHYFTLHHNWVCSGAPVFGQEGKSVGAVCLIGPSEKVSFHTLGMAAAAAESISLQLLTKQAYDEVELSQRRTEAIVESTPSGMLLFSQSLHVIYYNQRAAQLLERTEEELEHCSLWELFGRDDISERDLSLGFNDRYISVEYKGRQLNLTVTARAAGQGERVLILEKAENLHRKVSRIIGSEARFTFDDIQGTSPSLKAALRLGQIAAQTPSNVLITGESGTGKELFAQAIHNASDRRNGPFVAINCGALPKSLIESELFGYEGGTFTGARREGCAGKFELANGGTIFLDEIGDMPFDVQVALLRVLQSHEVSRLGSSKTIKVDVRVISATNKDLLAAIDNNQFRSDLYYRLNVFGIAIPPLRERAGDVRLLADYFLQKYTSFSGHCLSGFTEAAYALLEEYEWRGNIRELENAVERAVYLTSEGRIGAECFPSLQGGLGRRTDGVLHPAQAGRDETGLSIKALEQRQIEQALAQTHGNVKKAAQLLEISRRTMYRKLHQYGIDCDALRL